MATSAIMPEALLQNKPLTVAYFAILLLLIILIVWYLKPKAEHYYGYGMPNSYQVLASAPDVRFQEFSGTNQGSTPINMATVKQMYPGIASGARERLTGEREAPVFYDISQTLGAYQYATQFNCGDGSSPMPVKDSFGNMTYSCPDGSNPTQGGQASSGSERMTASPATAVQEALLQQQLGY